MPFPLSVCFVCSRLLNEGEITASNELIDGMIERFERRLIGELELNAGFFRWQKITKSHRESGIEVTVARKWSLGMARNMQGWAKLEGLGRKWRDGYPGKLEADDVDWLPGSGGVWGKGGVDCGR